MTEQFFIVGSGLGAMLLGIVSLYMALDAGRAYERSDLDEADYQMISALSFVVISWICWAVCAWFLIPSLQP